MMKANRAFLFVPAFSSILVGQTETVSLSGGRFWNGIKGVDKEAFEQPPDLEEASQLLPFLHFNIFEISTFSSNIYSRVESWMERCSTC